MKKGYLKYPISSLTVAFCMICIFFTSVFYYPKWEKAGSEATISWDVSGYYFYLPAIFIYKDVTKLEFKDEILDKYKPTSSFQQANLQENGNYVMMYSCGMAVQYLPFFLIAHTYALNSEYPADGFSLPYQFMMSMGSLIIALIGLILLRKSLLFYFSDKICALSILTIVLATNYFDYVSINGAMSHNYLFTLYSALIFLSIKFHKTPNKKFAILIGLVIGLAALSRPTEILLLLIPLLWGIKFPVRSSIAERIHFFKVHKLKILLSATACLLVGSLQFIYWKYAGGEWIIYSYGNEKFDWLKPHIWKGIFSYSTGWLVYTPIMYLSLFGIYSLYKQNKEMFLTSFLFILLYIYIAFSWSIWWYGGSLGQRTMVQTYALLAFPLAAFIHYLISQKIGKWIFFSVLVLFSYYNLWLTHQAHRGGLFMAEHMTKAYFWSTLGRYQVSDDQLKLLDTKEIFTGNRKNIKTWYQNDFESDTISHRISIPIISGKGSIYLDSVQKRTEEYNFEYRKDGSSWIRATADFRCVEKEWDQWRMPQFIVKMYNDNLLIKQNTIRIYRLLKHNSTKTIYIDTEIPNDKVNRISVMISNSGGKKPIVIDNLVVEGFN